MLVKSGVLAVAPSTISAFSAFDEVEEMSLSDFDLSELLSMMENGELEKLNFGDDAPSQGVNHSRESLSTTSVFEEESPSYDFGKLLDDLEDALGGIFAPPSEGDLFARSAAPQNTFDTALEGSEEEDETRTARQSGSSSAAGMYSKVN